MKIVYISNSYIPSSEANSMNVMNMCNAYIELGYEVILYTPKAKFAIDSTIKDIHGFYGVSQEIVIKRLSYPNIPGKPYIYAFCVWCNLRSDMPDYVIGRSVHGVYMASLLRIPFTFDSHGPVWGAGKLAEKLFRNMIIKRSFKRMTTNSRALKDIYLERYPQLGEQIEVAHNGSKIYDESKAELPGHNSIKVGYFGHLYKGRGIDILLQLSEKFLQVDFIIVGGTEKDIHYWNQKILSSNNVFFLGFISPAIVYKYRNACDILVAPYQRKVIVARGRIDSAEYMNPIKLFEYLSASKAIIASNLPPIKEILNSENSILVEPDVLSDWIKALAILVENNDLRIKISKNAKRDFLNNYTWIQRAKKLIY